MRPAWHLFRRELLSYFVSPVGWVIAVLFYLFRGLEVDSVAYHFSVSQGDLDLFARSYLFLSSSSFMIVLVPPILTMRSFAEEKRTGSFELLMTAPVRDHEVVLGKFAAAWAFFALLWLPTFAVLGVLQGTSYFNASLHMGPVLAGYLGLLLMGSLFLAAGLFTSSLTDNQLLASLAAMIFNTAILVAPGMLASPTQPLTGIPGALVSQLNVVEHLTGWFARGVVDTAHLVFYVSTTALFLFLTVRSVESRKWR
jgi:ABC-2 type transport system permease protein